MRTSAFPAALIVGGGVAGITMALQLARLGWRVTILEQDLQRRRRGHGLLLPGAALADLRQLGLAAPLAGDPTESFELCRPDGTVQERFPIPGSLGVLRRELMALLVEALPAAVQLRCGRCQALVDGGDGTVQVVAHNGEPIAADLIIAADGVHSICRRTLFPGAVLTPERVTELVFDLSAPDLAEELGGTCRKYLDQAAGLAIGQLPCGQGRLVIYAQLACQRHPLPADERPVELLRRYFAHWNPWLDRLLQRLDGAAAHRWHTTDLDPLPRLHQSNVVLIGDAAHPLLPFTSQGVPAAIADAACLAEELAAIDPSDPVQRQAALARYSGRRLPQLVPLLEEGRELQRRFLGTSSQQSVPWLPLVGFADGPAGRP